MSVNIFYHLLSYRKHLCAGTVRKNKKAGKNPKNPEIPKSLCLIESVTHFY